MLCQSTHLFNRLPRSPFSTRSGFFHYCEKDTPDNDYFMVASRSLDINRSPDGAVAVINDRHRLNRSNFMAVHAFTISAVGISGAAGTKFHG
jgi:hypothetical protein